jgi:hypothetical protein
MEPREQKKELEQPQESHAAEKPRRFRIVKLEERIAPAKGGNHTHNCDYGCLGSGYSTTTV